MKAKQKCGPECGPEYMLTDTKAKKIKPNDKPLADGTVIGLRLLSANKNGRGKRAQKLAEMKFYFDLFSKL